MRLVELAVAVGVLQPDDAMRLLLELHGDLLVGAGRIGDVEPALLVEVGDDGPIDQRRPGGQLDVEADRQREGMAVQLDLMRLEWLRSRAGIPATATTRTAAARAKRFMPVSPRRGCVEWARLC